MEQTTLDPETQTATDENELTALDRCDSCGAQAYVRAHFITGDLLFCAHHFTKFEASMTNKLLDVQDERHKLTSVAKLDVSPM